MLTTSRNNEEQYRKNYYNNILQHFPFILFIQINYKHSHTPAHQRALWKHNPT